MDTDTLVIVGISSKQKKRREGKQYSETSSEYHIVRREVKERDIHRSQSKWDKRKALLNIWEFVDSRLKGGGKICIQIS